jgi:hypothetical protein
MGDHTTETLQLQERRRNEAWARDRLLDRDCLYLKKTAMTWILTHIDCFVGQSQGNERVKAVAIYPYLFHGQDDEVWDKVGQAVGNMQALKVLRITTRSYRDDGDDGEDSHNPDWEMLARILRHIRQKVRVTLDGNGQWDAEESRSFAAAIHGHPTITCFEDSSGVFPCEASDALYSALATLPALESITLSNYGPDTQPEDESALANPESLTELSRLPSLRSVCFNHFYFTRALCEATATALMEGTAVTKLEFRDCSFSGARVDWSPIFLAMGNNTGLKSLIVNVCCGSMDESLCSAMQNGLGTNATLESLELSNIRLRDDKGDLWCRAFSFLRTSKALKSLKVGVQHGATNSCLSAFHIDIVAMLEENASLESLSIPCRNAFKIKAKELFVHATALQRNTTLKRLHLEGSGRLTLTHDEDEQMALLLKKNYALESLPMINLDHRPRDVGAILRLNAAGRRYLIEDGSSVSKGVEVLIAVRSDTNCVFLHLLENPRLCDRSAVERVTI